VTTFDAILLGLIQGFSEFLPISSSGHLVMGQYFLGVPSAGLFLEVALHVATLLSVVIVYRVRLLALAVGAVRREPEAWRYILLLGLATLPAALVGLTLKDQVGRAFDTPAVTGFMLLVTGALLFSTVYALRRAGEREIGWGLALLLGCAQAFAILPGISRSGTTITAGLWGRVDPVKVAEFSFLMSIPAIAGAAVLQLPDLSGSVEQIGTVPLLAGFIAALVSGIVAIRFLIWLLRKQSFHLFAYYVWTVGVLFLLYLWTRA
jgi:undecaprenyl-diphosphatase